MDPSTSRALFHFSRDTRRALNVRSCYRFSAGAKLSTLLVDRIIELVISAGGRSRHKRKRKQLRRDIILTVSNG